MELPVLSEGAKRENEDILKTGGRARRKPQLPNGGQEALQGE